MAVDKANYQKGEYEDRRHGNKIDCSNTIWIMATNALDDTILDFYKDNDAIAGDDGDERYRLVRKLSKQLQEGFLQQFGASFPYSRFFQFCDILLIYTRRRPSPDVSQTSFPCCHSPLANKPSSLINIC
jgi:hypothetical protein